MRQHLSCPHVFLLFVIVFGFCSHCMCKALLYRLHHPLQVRSRRSLAEPSCSELRAMWRQMQNRHSEMTNEIPRIPYPSDLFGFVLPPPPSMSRSTHKNRHRGSGHPMISLSPLPDSFFGQVVQEQQEPPMKTGWSTKHQKSKGRNAMSTGFGDFSDLPLSKGIPETLPGHFEDIPMPEEALGSYGTVVHSPEELDRLKHQRKLQTDHSYGRWGKVTDDIKPSIFDDEFGSFGKIVSEEPEGPSPDDFFFGSVQHEPSRFGGFPDEGPMERIGGRASSEYQGKGQESSCTALEGLTCHHDSDCHCPGSNYKCHESRCRPSPEDILTDEWGSWHNRPVESSQLGLVRQPRSIAM